MIWRGSVTAVQPGSNMTAFFFYIYIHEYLKKKKIAPVIFEYPTVIL